MPTLFRDIYRGKKVFITGHTGFKGSWLSLWLANLGAKVIGYSLDVPTHPSHFELLHLKQIFVRGNVLDKKRLQESINKYRPEIIFHLAAQPLVRQSYLDPVNAFESNVMGTVNLLESCRKNLQVKAIVNVTSDKCYRNNGSTESFREGDPLGGNDPYSASKSCADIIAHAYRQSFFNSENYGKSHSTLLASVRAGNVVGGGDWARDRLIPDIMRATSRREIVTIRYPRAKRSWQHVLEPLSGYLHLGWKLLEGKKQFSNDWNFGPGARSNLTVREVVAQTKKYWPQTRLKIKRDKTNWPEASLLMVDSTKARRELRWRSVWDVEKTFEKTALWYKNYYENGGIASQKDLDEYIRDAKQASVEWAKS